MELKPRTLRQEFLIEQVPLFAALLVLAYAAAKLQHGFVPGGDIAYPLAGVRVPAWHLVWMGFWTGYTMAVVGEAAGIFALPYQMSILQFNSGPVTPTTQLLTFLNPIGALFGFARNRQSNWLFAAWVCAGGIAGALAGPFVRLTLLADTKPFTLAVGVALAVAGLHLCWAAFRSARQTHGIEGKFKAEVQAAKKHGAAVGGIPQGIPIETIANTGRTIVIGFWGEQWSMSKRGLFLIGAGVGVCASALGVGGGFLLVPIFAAVYALPMYVLVAASIPYAIVLSFVAICTYTFIVPAFTGKVLYAEFAWGLFASAGGCLGSW
ncbi:MAG: TSUP family transporter, partial [Hyphomicrobiaceae bacterium]